MIQVNKEDMKQLRKRFPNLKATRTVHKYYIEEDPKVIAYLKNGNNDRGRQHA